MTVPAVNVASFILTEMSKAIMDIEDFVSFGIEKKACPFYLSRHAIAMDEADVFSFYLDHFSTVQLFD